MENVFLVLMLALLIDRFLGDPDWLWKRITHPVVIFGSMIKFADIRGNHMNYEKRTKRINGFIAIFLLVVLAALIGSLLVWICGFLGWFGLVVEAIIAACFLAQKSLADHVKTVFIALEEGGLRAGRRAVSMIVGRDPDKLDEVGVCRAAIESLAENSSDGVVAPVFWFALFGLPGLFVYKMINTADSMIGYKNSKYGDFGYASAKLDDLANYIPARLSGLLIVVSARFQTGALAANRAFQVMRADARKHRSPNAGWPESAYAGALDLSLAGPRQYGEQAVDALFQNANGRAPRSADILAAVGLFWCNMTVLFGLACILYVFSCLLF